MAKVERRHLPRSRDQELMLHRWGFIGIDEVKEVVVEGW